MDNKRRDFEGSYTAGEEVAHVYLLGYRLLAGKMEDRSTIFVLHVHPPTLHSPWLKSVGFGRRAGSRGILEAAVQKI